MGNIQIVQYEPKRAAAVADMWNHSREGWGGDNTIQTEERVLQSEANSVNINTYLAVDGDTVLGYCGISEYREDTGALYIALLNVRDDYHGRKIGKQLVLKAIDRTVELGWPRIDLYTWASNTKAVPLYKKCGFFWEDRDDTVHLMNFIPTVLQTEAVQDFFQYADWYDDSVRNIEVKPDGKKEGEFDFYEYAWEKNDRRLRMEFERKGRGLRLIETDDYLLYASIERQNLVFGEQYPIEYTVVNKSGKPLHLSFTGRNDQNIQFDWKHEVTVEQSTVIKSRFFIQPIEEEQSIWRTHPTVKTSVLINGKEAIFKIGINPKYPAKISTVIPDGASFLDVVDQFYIEVENNYNEEITLDLQLPDTAFMTLHNGEQRIHLKSKERKSIPISYQLQAFGYYAPTLSVDVIKSDGSKITFTKTIGIPFHGIGAKLFGESDQYWEIYNGMYHVWLDKFDNRILPGRSTTPHIPEQSIYLYYPKIGKPFSSEFSKKRPERVVFFEENSAICFKATYRSTDFNGLLLHSVVKLYAEGLVEHHFEVENTTENTTIDPIWMNKSIRNDLFFGVVPYDGQILDLDGQINGQYAVWQSKKLSENWTFSNRADDPYGLAWANEDTISFENWFLTVEQALGHIPAQSSVQAKPTFLSIGAFHSWQQFRQFALKNTKLHSPRTIEPVQFYPSDHNPFVQSQATVVWKDARLTHLDGEIQLQAGAQGQQLLQQRVTKDAQVNEVSFAVELDKDASIHVLKATAHLALQTIERQTLLIPKGDGDIQQHIIDDAGIPVYTVDNGILQIKSAPAFAPSLFSLIYKGNEWLDTAYPNTITRSWWNPWLGGIRDSFHKITQNSLLKEPRTAEFVHITDQHQNDWHGIKVTVHIQSHEHYTGLKYHQYYLLMANVPILCHMTEIEQNTNMYFHFDKLVTISAFKPQLAENVPAKITFYDEKNVLHHIYAGVEEHEYILTNSMCISYDGRKEKMQIISDTNECYPELFVNKEVLHLHTFHHLHMSHGTRKVTSPTFYAFTDQLIPEAALHELKNIRFTRNH